MVVRVGLCQFQPCFKDVAESQRRAEGILQTSELDGVDVLVLPEMSFTGYVFDSIEEITPYLEDGETGPSVTWAKTWAVKLRTHIIVGFPQRVRGPTPDDDRRYNSVAVVRPDGTVHAMYHKHFLYETDENWAHEGPSFATIDLPGMPRIALGICMDINPYRFQNTFCKYEYARFHERSGAQILLLNMAWLRSEDYTSQRLIQYWVARLEPLMRKPGLRVAICNRIGTEKKSTFAGTSCAVDLERATLLACLDDVTSRVLIVEL